MPEVCRADPVWLWMEAGGGDTHASRNEAESWRSRGRISLDGSGPDPGSGRARKTNTNHAAVQRGQLPNLGTLAPQGVQGTGACNVVPRKDGPGSHPKVSAQPSSLLWPGWVGCPVTWPWRGQKRLGASHLWAQRLTAPLASVLIPGQGVRRGNTESSRPQRMWALPPTPSHPCPLHCDSLSILCFSISCTSAMDSRRSSVNFFRS